MIRDVIAHIGIEDSLALALPKLRKKCSIKIKDARGDKIIGRPAGEEGDLIVLRIIGDR